MGLVSAPAVVPGYFQAVPTGRLVADIASAVVPEEVVPSAEDSAKAQQALAVLEVADESALRWSPEVLESGQEPESDARCSVPEATAGPATQEHGPAELEALADPGVRESDSTVEACVLEEDPFDDRQGAAAEEVPASGAS